jgi:hypothetical protein
MVDSFPGSFTVNLNCWFDQPVLILFTDTFLFTDTRLKRLVTTAVYWDDEGLVIHIS